MSPAEEHPAIQVTLRIPLAVFPAPSHIPMPPDRPPHRDHPHPYARPAAPERPGPVPHPTVRSSDASLDQGSRLEIPNEPPLFPLLSRIRIHILPTKLDGELPTMYAHVESLGGIISPAQDAEIIVTALRGRPRLIKVLGSAALVDSRWILSLAWVKSAYQAAVAYAEALAEKGLTGWEEDEEGSRPAAGLAPIVRAYVAQPSVPAREEFAIPGTGVQVRNPPEEVPVISDAQDEETEHPTGDLEPFPVDIDLRDIPNRAVQRCSPLTCVNQDIVSRLRKTRSPLHGSWKGP